MNYTKEQQNDAFWQKRGEDRRKRRLGRHRHNEDKNKNDIKKDANKTEWNERKTYPKILLIIIVLRNFFDNRFIFYFSFIALIKIYLYKSLKISNLVIKIFDK